MKKRKLGKKAKRISVVLAVIFIAVLIYFAVNFFSVRKEIRAKEEELAEIATQYQEQLKQNDELQKTIDENDEAAIAEKYAREHGYVKTDERVYIDVTPGNTK
jgi:cell division protein FtsL